MPKIANSNQMIAAALIGFGVGLFPIAVKAEMRSRDCGNTNLKEDIVSDNSLFYLEDGQWTKLEKNETFSDIKNKIFAFVANDGRELEGGMVLVKVVDFYRGQDIRDKSVKLFRDEYVSKKQKAKQEFKGQVDIDRYQRAHAVDGRGADLGSTLREFHARNYVIKGSQVASTDSSVQKKRNFLFEERQLNPSESLISRLFGPKEATGKENKAEPEGKSLDSGKISVDQFSVKLKYYTHLPSDKFDVVCFSIKPREEVLRTKISIRDFEYDGPERDTDPIGRSANWVINWSDTK